MVQFKTNEVKNVGKVQVSAKRLRELASKLEETRGTDGNEPVEVYIVPGKDKESIAQLAFDFSKKETEIKEKYQEEKPEQHKEAENKTIPDGKKNETEVKEEKKADDKPAATEQQPKVEEQTNASQESAKPTSPAEVIREKNPPPSVSEVERITKDTTLARQANEIKEKAYKKDDK